MRTQGFGATVAVDVSDIRLLHQGLRTHLRPVREINGNNEPRRPGAGEERNFAWLRPSAGQAPSGLSDSLEKNLCELVCILARNIFFHRILPELLQQNFTLETLRAASRQVAVK